MDTIALTELILALAATAAVMRLVYLGLTGEFPALLAFLVFLAVKSLAYGLLDQASTGYFWSYVILEPLECALSIIAVRELFALTFRNYPGIRVGGRWIMYVGIVLAIAVSLMVTGFFWNVGASGRAHSGLFYYEVSERSIVLALALVIVAILLFLSKYPLYLGRNTRISSVFFSVLFLCEACRLLIDSLAPQLNNHFVDWAANTFVAASLAGWAAMLTARQGAPEPVRVTRPQDAHLLQQLNSLNQFMTRAARR
jgi:hypothetical protein